jgi:glucokinase
VKNFVGIDFGGTKIKIGIINAKGKIIHKDIFSTDIDQSGQQIIQQIAGCTKQVIADSGLRSENIAGIGIGSPGLLNPETGQLKIVVNIPQLNDIFIATALHSILNLPTFLDNDVNAMALGEFYYGAAKGYENIVALTLGTGVGGGIILNGKLYRGTSFTAGEIGHLSIDPNGPVCPCGNYGCLERYIGRDGILARFRLYQSKGLPTRINDFLDNGKVTPKAIAQAAEANDPLSIEVLAETGKILGIALASLTNVLNPEIFVIGGGIANAGDLILNSTRHELIKRAYTIPAQAVKVVPAAFKNDAGIIGSASIAACNLL